MMPKLSEKDILLCFFLTFFEGVLLKKQKLDMSI